MWPVGGVSPWYEGGMEVISSQREVWQSELDLIGVAWCGSMTQKGSCTACDQCGSIIQQVHGEVPEDVVRKAMKNHTRDEECQYRDG